MPCSRDCRSRRAAFGYYAARASCSCSSSPALRRRHGRARWLCSGKVGLCRARSASSLAVVVGALVAYGAAKLIACLVQHGRRRFRRMARDRRRSLERSHARPSHGDGRRGRRAPCCSASCCSAPCRCPSSRRRTAIIRGSTSPAAGKHAQADRGGDRPRRGHRGQGSERRTRVRARQRRRAAT